jgi:hypothetical protein
VVTSSPEPDEPTSLPGLPLHTSQHANNMQANTCRDGETFNLDNVSGNNEPDTSNCGHNLEINDPNITRASTMKALDIKYFFNKKSNPEKLFCEICK